MNPPWTRWVIGGLPPVRVISDEGAPKTAALRGCLDLDGPGLVVGLAFEFRDKAYGRGGEGIAHD